MRAEIAGSSLAASWHVLFAVFVISVLVTLGLAIYAGGALIGVRRSKVETFSVPPTSSPYTTLTTPPPPPVRAARGTTPPPFPVHAVGVRAASPTPPGVISNRDDATDPEISADARFSVRRSRPRL